MKTKTRKKKGRPDLTDAHIGRRLRLRRSLMGLSQEKLADAVGVSFQQVQKYEKGTNRVSGGRLLQFSRILDVPIDYFYEELQTYVKSKSPSYGFSDSEQAAFIGDDMMNSKETANLLRNYYKLKPAMRKDVLKLIKSMSEGK